MLVFLWTLKKKKRLFLQHKREIAFTYVLTYALDAKRFQEQFRKYLTTFSFLITGIAEITWQNVFYFLLFFLITLYDFVYSQINYAKKTFSMARKGEGRRQTFLVQWQTNKSSEQRKNAKEKSFRKTMIFDRYSR